MPFLHRFVRCTATTLMLAGCAGRITNPTGAAEESVAAAINARAARTPGAVVRVIAARLDGRGPRIAIHADSLVHAASTMKVPVMIALAQADDRGMIRLDDSVPLTNRFASIVDGSPFTLDRGADSDDAVYARVGERVPIRWLATRMITHSSNLATNALITRLDPVRITALARGFGATSMVVRRGVEDNVAFRAGLNNTTTANDLVALFTALERGAVATGAGTREMLQILEAQAFNEQIPAGLPPGTRIAHKTGAITATWHDAGLVYRTARAPYAIAILTRAIPEDAVADRLIADCSRIVWDWLSTPERRTRRAPRP